MKDRELWSDNPLVKKAHSGNQEAEPMFNLNSLFY